MPDHLLSDIELGNVDLANQVRSSRGHNVAASVMKCAFMLINESATAEAAANG
jgi:hypothetical protein